jgi:phytoene synthase
MAQSLLDELPPAQRLALAYAPHRARTQTLALFALDARLAGILRRRGEPVLAQMRLAWWRDVLRKEQMEWPKGEAVLGLLRGWRQPSALVPLVDGWETLLAEPFDSAATDQFVSGRAAAFRQLAAEFGLPLERVDEAASFWALADLAANLADPAERSAVVAASTKLPPCGPLPRELRPLLVLAALGRRSLARGGQPLLGGFGAALLAMRVGITGR